MRLWYFLHRQPAKAQASLRESRQSLRCWHTLSMDEDEGSDQKSDIQPHWMAAHVRLKNKFTEDENLMRWLFCTFTNLSSFPLFR